MGCLVLDKAIRKVSEGEIFEQSPTKKRTETLVFSGTGILGNSFIQRPLDGHVLGVEGMGRGGQCG